MAVNSKGPFEVQIPYIAADGFPHTFRANAIVAGADPAPGTPADDVTLVTRGGSVDLDTGVNALWNVIRNALPSTTTAEAYSFWKIPTGGGDPIFVTAGALATPDGATGAMIENQCEIYTFRSANGGIGKIMLMDTNNASVVRVPLAPANPIAAYVCGPTSWVIARDDGFLIAPINYCPSPNEALFNARHR
jgi:hypothetical protein